MEQDRTCGHCKVKQPARNFNGNNCNMCKADKRGYFRTYAGESVDLPVVASTTTDEE